MCAAKRIFLGIPTLRPCIATPTMRYASLLIGLIWIASACAKKLPPALQGMLRHDSHNASEADTDLPLGHHGKPGPVAGMAQMTSDQKNRRDTWPMNCHIHDWPYADVAAIREAYSWFYDLVADLGADAQCCRRVACFDTSGVWVCADSLDYKYPNSVVIADTMNPLMDGDNGCLDPNDKTKVQGQMFTSDGWNVIIRGGEDCTVEPPEQPIFY